MLWGGLCCQMYDIRQRHSIFSQFFQKLLHSLHCAPAVPQFPSATFVKQHSHNVPDLSVNNLYLWPMRQDYIYIYIYIYLYISHFSDLHIMHIHIYVCMCVCVCIYPWVSVTPEWRLPSSCGRGVSLQIWRLAANIMIRQTWATD